MIQPSILFWDLQLTEQDILSAFSQGPSILFWDLLKCCLTSTWLLCLRSLQFSFEIFENSLCGWLTNTRVYPSILFWDLLPDTGTTPSPTIILTFNSLLRSSKPFHVTVQCTEVSNGLQFSFEIF